eukprot:scaffold7381_cov310-Pinguiococcus_pyrenoidosus.AAC.46
MAVGSTDMLNIVLKSLRRRLQLSLGRASQHLLLSVKVTDGDVSAISIHAGRLHMVEPPGHEIRSIRDGRILGPVLRHVVVHVVQVLLRGARPGPVVAHLGELRFRSAAPRVRQLAVERPSEALAFGFFLSEGALAYSVERDPIRLHLPVHLDRLVALDQVRAGNVVDPMHSATTIDLLVNHRRAASRCPKKRPSRGSEAMTSPDPTRRACSGRKRPAVVRWPTWWSSARSDRCRAPPRWTPCPIRRAPAGGCCRRGRPRRPSCRPVPAA